MAVFLLAASVVVTVALPAGANTSTPSNIPYTCATSFGPQPGSYSASITDTADPAAVGQSVTYTFVVPFAQDPPPVTATYKGGTTKYAIPAGLNVTAVSTPPKAGSNLTSTASVQGGFVVVTSTGSQPIDGGSHPTPDLIVTGTVTAAAAGPGVVWKTPASLVANVNAQIVGDIVATCTPNDPNTVIATTTVPAGPKTPVPTNQTVAVKFNGTKAITLSATDTDNTPAQLTYSVASQPAHGTLTGTAPALTYKPTAGYTGADSFTFTVRDPQNNSATGTITIKALPPIVIDNAPPTITIAAPVNGALLTPGQVVNASFTCADVTTAVESCTGTTATGAPVSATVGVHVFTVNAVDTAGNRARQTVSYRVIETAIVQQTYNAANQIPVACDDPLPLSQHTIPATVSAPSQVGPGANMRMRFAAGANSVAALMTATNISYTLAVPTNGTATSAAIVANTGTANARGSASVAVVAGKVVLTIAGPIAGGTTAATAFTPPTIDVTIKAGTTPNAQVWTRFAQYQETDTLSGVGQVPMTHTCTAGDPANGQANPVLTKSAIIDITPPTVTLSAPATGGLYGIGAAVPVHFTCADNVAVATCQGTVANGANLSTATAGVKTLSATSTDAAGNFAEKFASVRVVQTTFTTRYENSQLPLLDATAAFFNTDRSGLARLGVSAIRSLIAANPPTTPAVPPVNTGPVAVMTSYTPAEGQVVGENAALVGLTGDELHKSGVLFATYFYVTSGA